MAIPFLQVALGAARVATDVAVAHATHKANKRHARSVAKHGGCTPCAANAALNDMYTSLNGVRAATGLKPIKR